MHRFSGPGVSRKADIAFRLKLLHAAAIIEGEYFNEAETPADRLSHRITCTANLAAARVEEYRRMGVTTASMPHAVGPEAELDLLGALDLIVAEIIQRSPVHSQGGTNIGQWDNACKLSAQGTLLLAKLCHERGILGYPDLLANAPARFHPEGWRRHARADRQPAGPK